MPSTGAVKAAQQRRYAQSPEGIAARRRAKEKLKERRRMQREASQSIPINPAPLTQALSAWRT